MQSPKQQLKNKKLALDSFSDRLQSADNLSNESQSDELLELNTSNKLSLSNKKSLLIHSQIKDNILYPPIQDSTFFDYYKLRRNYDEFASNSLSKAKKLYEEFYKRYRYLKNLGINTPKPPLLSVFDFLNEDKIIKYEKEIQNLNLPDDIKSQVLDLDKIKEEIKQNAKNSEDLLKELERSTGWAKKLSADILANTINVVNDPIQWLTLIIPTPTKFVPGVAIDSAISGATEGFINHYFLNPRKKELELDQTNLKQAIIDGAIGGGVASGLFRGVGKLADKFLLKDSKKQAENFVTDKVLNDPIPDKTSNDLIGVINGKGDFEELSVLEKKELSDLEKNLDKKLDLKEDFSLSNKEELVSTKEKTPHSEEEPNFKEDLLNEPQENHNINQDKTLAEAKSEIEKIIPELKTKITEADNIKLKSETAVKLKIAEYLKKHSNSYTASKTKDPKRAFSFYLDEYSIEIGRYTGLMEYFLDDFYSKFTKKDFSPDLDINFIKEIYDIDTKDIVAKELKSVFSNKINNFVLNELKDLGVDLKPLKNYFPQNHNKRLLLKQGKKDWINFTENLLNWEKIEKQTAKKIFDENNIKDSEFIQNFKIENKQDFLNQIYDLIISDGTTNIDLNKYTIKNSLHKKLLADRTLHFKDADSFYNYSKEFGNSENVIDSIVTYIDRFSKNLSILKMFGPNPSNTFDWTKKLLLKNSKKNINFSVIDSAFEKITNPTTFIADNTIGNIYTSFYSLRSSALLSGSSVLAYITDPITSALTSSYNGLNIIRTILKSYAPGLGISKQIARRTGLIIEHYTNIDAGRVRYDIATTNAKKLFNWTMKYSGMNYITDRGRWIFSTEFMATLKENSNKSFNQTSFHKSMEFYNIAEKDWDFLRQNSKTINQNNLELLSPISLYDLNSKQGSIVAEKFMKMILTEQQRAIPSHSLISSVALTGKTKPDSVPGMILHSFSSLKNFPLTIFRQHILQRALPLLVSDKKVSYIAGLLLSSTLLGALYTQLQQLSRGKTAMDMSNKEFWMNAIDRGGGLGILGSALTLDDKKDILKEITGLAIGGITDVADLTILEILKKTKGEKSNYGKKVSAFIKDNMPLRRNMAANLLIDRYIVDQIQLALDPDAYKSFKRSEDFIKKKFNQQYWWKQGEVLPG